MEKFKEDIDRIEWQRKSGKLNDNDYHDAIDWALDSFNKRIYGVINRPLTEEELSEAEREYLNIINNNLE